MMVDPIPATPIVEKPLLVVKARGGVTVEVDDLELASLAPLLALAGVQLEVRGKVTADIDTKIEAGHLILEDTPFELNQIITDVKATPMRPCLVRIYTDEGVMGIGECSPMNTTVIAHCQRKCEGKIL